MFCKREELKRERREKIKKKDSEIERQEEKNGGVEKLKKKG